MRLTLDCNVLIGAGLAEARQASRGADQALRHDLAVAVLVVPERVSFGLVDPSDEVYLATAVAGSAELLATGNSRHVTAAAYGAVRLVSPAAGILLLGRPAESPTGNPPPLARLTGTDLPTARHVWGRALPSHPPDPA